VRLRGFVVNDLLNRAGTISLAIVLAVIVWIVSANQENPSIMDVFPDPIPLEIRNRPSGTVVFGDVVDRVQVVIRAPRSSWDNLRTGSFQAWIDLNGLDPDIHDVDVQVRSSDRAVRVEEKRPSRVGVRLETLKEKTVEVRPVVVDSPPLGYIYRTPEITPAMVTVRGPSSVVDQVESVVSDIYLQGARTDLERAVALMPRDAEGEVVAWVELDPPRVNVRVPVEQRIGYKDASVRVVLKGQVTSGYRITNVSVDPSVVTVVGSPASLAQVGGYLETRPIDVSQAEADVVERVTLSLPEGVSLLGTQSVVINVSVMPLQGGLTLQGLPLTIQGLESDLTAAASPDGVDVILSGPMPRLEPLDRDEVQVIVDVYGMLPGVHKIAPTVVAPEGVNVESVLPDIVEVRIERKTSPAVAVPPQSLTTEDESDASDASTPEATPETTSTDKAGAGEPMSVFGSPLSTPTASNAESADN
jgi:YbbR domain-containing protein